MALEQMLSVLMAHKKAIASIVMLMTAVAASTGLATLYIALVFKLREHSLKEVIRSVFIRVEQSRPA